MLETRERQDLRRNWVAAFSSLPCGRYPGCSFVRYIFTSKGDSVAETAAMFFPFAAWLDLPLWGMDLVLSFAWEALRFNLQLLLKISESGAWKNLWEVLARRSSLLNVDFNYWLIDLNDLSLLHKPPKMTDVPRCGCFAPELEFHFIFFPYTLSLQNKKFQPLCYSTLMCRKWSAWVLQNWGG